MAGGEVQSAEKDDFVKRRRGKKEKESPAEKNHNNDDTATEFSLLLFPRGMATAKSRTNKKMHANRAKAMVCFLFDVTQQHWIRLLLALL